MDRQKRHQVNQLLHDQGGVPQKNTHPYVQAEVHRLRSPRHRQIFHRRQEIYSLARVLNLPQNILRLARLHRPQAHPPRTTLRREQLSVELVQTINLSVVGQ